MKVSIILNELFLKMAKIISPADMGSRFEEMLDKYGNQTVIETCKECKYWKRLENAKYRMSICGWENPDFGCIHFKKKEIAVDKVGTK